MFEILKNHWQDIIIVLTALVSLVMFFVRKPVTSSLDSDLISDLTVLIAGWIKQVETAGHGDTKKETVVNLSLKYLKKRFGRDLDDDELNIWRKRVSTLIELYLSTPQKKEVLDEKNQIKK